MMIITKNENKRKQAKESLKKAVADFKKAFSDWDSLPHTSHQRADFKEKREAIVVNKHKAFCEMKQAYKKQTDAFDRIIELYKDKPSA